MLWKLTTFSSTLAPASWSIGLAEIDEKEHELSCHPDFVHAEFRSLWYFLKDPGSWYFSQRHSRSINRKKWSNYGNNNLSLFFNIEIGMWIFSFDMICSYLNLWSRKPCCYYPDIGPYFGLHLFYIIWPKSSLHIST